MKHLLQMMVIVLFSAMPACAQSYQVLGYYTPCSNVAGSSQPTLSTFTWSDVTIVGMIGVGPNGGTTGTLNYCGTYNDATIGVGALITAAHAHGVKVILDFGTANGTMGGFSGVYSNQSSMATLASNIAAEVSSVGADGADIDYEEGWNATLMTNLLSQLRSDMTTCNGHACLLTATSGNANTYWTGSAIPICDNTRGFSSAQVANLDYLILMAYDLGDATNDNPYTWFNSPLDSDGAGIYVWSADYLFKATQYTGASCNFSSSKTLMGVPFYGDYYVGYNGPRQGSGTGYSSLQVGYGTIVTSTASGCMAHQQYCYTSPTYDSNAKVPWQQQNSSSYLTWDDCTSIGTKATYVKANAMGGMAIWSLGWDNISTATYPLLYCMAADLLGSANIFYVAASGSDSNSGTSKATPWLHAPGMVSCTANCAAHTPQSGDSFIFRGGDTWHFGNSSATPYAGAQAGWNWTWSGSSGNPIYIGVDKTWYSGGSWTKPALDGDNPTSTGFVASCPYPFNSNPSLVNFGSQSYWQWDNFELRGVCWQNQVANAGFINLNGGSATNFNISNLYCHGWTMTFSSYDNYACIQAFGGGTLADNSRVSYSIFDGSDSPHFPANSTNCQYQYPAPCASGQAIQGRMATVDHNIFRYLSNMIVSNNTVSYHDNLAEYLEQTFASGAQQHGNVINELGCPTGSTNQFYNNIVRNTYSTQLVYLAVCTTTYVFNNVFFNNLVGYGAGGCLRLNSVSNSSSTQTAYIYGNTFGDATCQFKFEVANSPLTPWNGTGNFENNHFIGFSSPISNFYICNTGGMCLINDNGGELFQTTGVANGQGYVVANNYAPTLPTNSTVSGAPGGNLTSSCSTFSSDLALCSGTGGGPLQSGSNTLFPAITLVSRPSSGGWNIGAYQFSGSGGGGNKGTVLAPGIVIMKGITIQ